MIIRDTPPLHLTYCLNVHPGEQWAQNLEAIRTHTLAVRDRIAPGKPFGLGLRLSRQAAGTLVHPDTLADFKAFLSAQNLYVFTINGFPYGAFHGQPVKTEVYRPDWSTRERLDYTLLLAQILSRVLPDNTGGSISTLPLGYRAHFSGEPAPATMGLNLAECAIGLNSLRLETGKEIHLGLEPEPDCLLETTRDVIQFFEGSLLDQGIPYITSRLSCNRREAEDILRRHIGICFDTCHLAVQFETLPDSLSLLTKHGIRISKVQLSSALEVVPTQTARQDLVPFIDPVYLHQVKRAEFPDRGPGTGDPSILSSYTDLPDALATRLSRHAESERWRIHFHVPLYFQGGDAIQSTTQALDQRFWDVLKQSPVDHLEIETYTFHVLPGYLQQQGLEASIAQEYEWVQREYSRPVSVR